MRPRKILDRFSSRYPKCWRELEEFRKAADKLAPGWPEWCYIPAAACHAVVSRGKDDISQNPELIPDIGIMQALAGWRLTQSVYRFDPLLYQELTSTPVTGDIPVDILYTLPEWSVYIELQNDYAHGVWACLEWDANDGHSELRLVFDIDDGFLHPLPIHLGGTVEEGLQSMRQYARDNSPNNAFEKKLSEYGNLNNHYFNAINHLLSNVGGIVSLILYLCSEKPDLQSNSGKSAPGRPTAVKTKKHGKRYYPPKNPSLWEAGYRISTFLRQARQPVSNDPVSGTGNEHSSPAPHIRKAHWHTYWTGPRKDPNKRRPILKWIPPTPVGFSWDTDVPVPTLKRVRD